MYEERAWSWIGVSQHWLHFLESPGKILKIPMSRTHCRLISVFGRGSQGLEVIQSSPGDSNVWLGLRMSKWEGLWGHSHLWPAQVEIAESRLFNQLSQTVSTSHSCTSNLVSSCYAGSTSKTLSHTLEVPHTKDFSPFQIKNMCGSHQVLSESGLS